jgi:chromatin segregation and condensation protein Rec8/ScpA/Scc1 (kleisin family)
MNKELLNSLEISKGDTYNMLEIRGDLLVYLSIVSTVKSELLFTNHENN